MHQLYIDNSSLFGGDHNHHLLERERTKVARGRHAVTTTTSHDRDGHSVMNLLNDGRPTTAAVARVLIETARRHAVATTLTEPTAIATVTLTATVTAAIVTASAIVTVTVIVTDTVTTRDPVQKVAIRRRVPESDQRHRHEREMVQVNHGNRDDRSRQKNIDPRPSS